MTCARCDDLARRLAAAEEELAAWRANDRDERAGRDHADWSRVKAWRDLLPDLPPSPALMLLALLDARGRTLSPEKLMAATAGSPGKPSDHDPDPKIANVHVWRLRRALRAAARLGRIPARHRAQDGGVTTDWGQGYAIAPDVAAALKAAAGEA